MPPGGGIPPPGGLPCCIPYIIPGIISPPPIAMEIGPPGPSCGRCIAYASAPDALCPPGGIWSSNWCRATMVGCVVDHRSLPDRAGEFTDLEKYKCRVLHQGLNFSFQRLRSVANESSNAQFKVALSVRLT